ncbi:MAG: DUF2079 domain-containing protein [Patescibacteria group bacterium]|nr:DUF2079 domain-containing protein [Patescibacteria group bacterium]
MRRNTLIVGLAAGAYLLIFGIFTAIRQYHFQTQAWDMGIFDQLFWNTLHGRFMQGTLEELPQHFGIHFSPFLLALVPLYALVPSPYTLLFLQTGALALGVFPLYGIACRKLTRPFPEIIAGAYLLSPALQWVNIFDFHSVAFFIPLFLAAWYFAEQRSYLPASAFFLLAAATKEDAPLVILFAGLFFLIRGWRDRDRRVKSFGGILALAAGIYFAATIYMIMPAFGGGLLRIDRYQELGGSFSALLLSPFLKPAAFLNTIFQFPKLMYVFWLFAPLLFLPLASGSALLLLAPGLAENLLTSYQPQFSGLYQYDALLIPGLFISTIYGIQWLAARHPAYVNKLKSGLIATIAIGFLFRAPISPFTFPSSLFSSNLTWDTYASLLARIPDNASVSAFSNLVPHLSERKEVYLFGSEDYRPVDYFIIDGADLSGFGTPEAFQSYVDYYMSSGDYTYTELDNRYFILKRITPADGAQ